MKYLVSNNVIHVSPLLMSDAPTFEFTRRTTREQKLAAIGVVIFYTEMLEKVGWFEHTSDWDIHQEIQLDDARYLHIDGGRLTSSDFNGQFYLGDGHEYGDHAVLDAGVHIDRDEDRYWEGGDWLEYLQGDDESSYYRIPLDRIVSISIGYCS